MTEQIETVRVRVLPGGRVSRADAAAFLGRKPKTLAVWAAEKRGPTPINAGGRIFYLYDEVRRFAGCEPQQAA